MPTIAPEQLVTKAGGHPSRGDGMEPLIPPSALLTSIGNPPDPGLFVKSLEHLRRDVHRYLHEGGFALCKFNTILDLGCGPGRFPIAFARGLGAHQMLYGCDVSSACISWCRENIPWATFATNTINPPLPYQANQFDLVHALSVFTHLRLDLQFRWAWEVHRILKPGGVLFLTMHGSPFFRYHVERMSQGCTRLAELSTFGDAALCSYFSERGLEEDEGQHRVVSCMTPSCVREVFSAFELVKYFPETGLAAGQDIYIFRKPLDATVVAIADLEGEETVSFTQSLRSHESLTLPFHLQGQRTFRVYPAMTPEGAYRTDYSIEMSTGTQILAEHAGTLNTYRVFGRSHHAILTVPVPPLHARVMVRLSATVSDRNMLPDDAQPHIFWDYPHWS